MTSADDEPAALLGVVAAPPPFALAVAIVRCHASDGAAEAIRHYLDRAPDELLAAVALHWPGGQRSAPTVVKAEIRGAVRRRRQARGWTDWPAALRAAARDVAGPVTS